MALIAAGLLAVLLLAVHIWFVNNARGILKAIVTEKSDGKIALELRHVRFNFFSNRLQISHGDLRSTDTARSNNAYRVRFNKLTLKVRSFWPLLLQNDLTLDSIHILNPLVEVTRLRKDTSATNDSQLSLTQEMGKMYNSLLNTLKNFGIRRILVDKASVKFVDRTVASSRPVWITNIYLNVLRNPESKTITAEQEVDLKSTNQVIRMPGGRHRLAFKRFNLQLFRRRIELDSCTITAVPTGLKSSSYQVFFKKLSLVGVDFAAMSTLNLIRADTVICQNPIFNINLPARAQKKEETTLEPRKMIRDLTSDLDLKYVGVQNAGIHITYTDKDKKRFISNTNRDNFEIRGLKIDAGARRPVHIDRFDMMVREYDLYNADSSASFSFDSILFRNNRIILNNFTVNTTPSQLYQKSQRDFRFPRFELSGLNWYQLIFNQNVVAREAVLIDPLLRYTKKTPNRERKTSFFAALQSIDSLMTLERLSIVNGTFLLNFGTATGLNLHNVHLRVSSNELLAATNQQTIQKAVDYFSMVKGELRRRDLTATMRNVRFTEGNVLLADRLTIRSAPDNTNADITDVKVNNMLLDERTETIYADGIEWNSAVVQLRTAPEKKHSRKSQQGSLDIHNISGKNTTLLLFNGTTNINSAVSELQIDSLVKVNNGVVKIAGAHVRNNRFVLENDRKIVHADVGHMDVQTIKLRNEARDIEADGITWSNANLDMRDLVTAKEGKNNNGSLVLTGIEGKSTALAMENANGSIAANLDLVKAGLLSKIGKEPFTAADVHLLGSNLALEGMYTVAGADTFQLADNAPSFIQKMRWQKVTAFDTVRLQSPLLYFSADVNSLLTANHHLFSILVTDPEITVSQKGKQKVEQQANAKPGSLLVDGITLLRPSITYVSASDSTTNQASVAPVDGGAINITGLSLDSAGLAIGGVQLTSPQTTVTIGNKRSSVVAGGHTRVALRDVFAQQSSSGGGWQLVVDSLEMRHPNNLLQQHQGNRLVLSQLSAGNLVLNQSNLQSVDSWLASNATARLQSSTGQYADSERVYSWYNAGYNKAGGILTVDSFTMQPRLTRQNFMAQSTFESDYIQFKTGHIYASAFNLDSFNHHQAIIADSIYLHRPQAILYRDKALPSEPPQKKPLPTAALQQVRSPLNIRIIAVDSGLVSYTEKNDVSAMEGTLLLTNMHGAIRNIYAQPPTTTDSLHIHMHMQLMNQAGMQVRLAQAYHDTAYAFRLHLALQPTELSILNPVMVPLSGVKIKSGYVDTLLLDAIAREHFAAGKALMRYDNLRIQLLNKRNPGKRSLRNRLLTFIANTFVVRNSNTNKTHAVYLERMREKSFFNYLLKMALGGMGVNIGTQSSNKNLKQLKAEMEKRQIPADYFNGVVPQQ